MGATMVRIDVPGIFTQPRNTNMIVTKSDSIVHKYQWEDVAENAQGKIVMRMIVRLARSRSQPPSITLEAKRIDAVKKVGMKRMWTSSELFGVSRRYVDLTSINLDVDVFQDSACVLQEDGIVSVTLRHMKVD